VNATSERGGDRERSQSRRKGYRMLGGSRGGLSTLAVFPRGGGGGPAVVLGEMKEKLNNIGKKKKNGSKGGYSLGMRKNLSPR